MFTEDFGTGLDAAIQSLAGYMSKKKPAGGGVFESVKTCHAAKVARGTAIANITMQAVILLLAVYLVFTGTKDHGAWGLLGLQLVSVLTGVLMIVQYRHALKVAAKVLWFGTGKDTKRVIGMTLAGIATSAFVKAGGWVTVAAAAAIVGLTIARIVFQSLALKQGSRSEAVLAVGLDVLDRVVTRKRIEAVRM